MDHRLLLSARHDLELVAAEGPSAESRSSAIDSLSLCCFVASEEPESPREVMDLLRRCWRTGECGTVYSKMSLSQRVLWKYKMLGACTQFP